MKYVAPKGSLEWKIVLDTLGFAVDEKNRICDGTGKSAKCRECSEPVTIDNMGLMFRERDGQAVFVCHACHLVTLFEMLEDDEEVRGTEFDSTDLDSFIAGFEKMMSSKKERP